MRIRMTTATMKPAKSSGLTASMAGGPCGRVDLRPSKDSVLAGCTALFFARLRSGEKGDEVGALLRVLHPGVAHAGARHAAERVGEEAVEAVAVPHDAGALQRRRV